MNLRMLCNAVLNLLLAGLAASCAGTQAPKLRVVENVADISPQVKLSVVAPPTWSREKGTEDDGPNDSQLAFVEAGSGKVLLNLKGRMPPGLLGPRTLVHCDAEDVTVSPDHQHVVVVAKEHRWFTARLYAVHGKKVHEIRSFDIPNVQATLKQGAPDADWATDEGRRPFWGGFSATWDDHARLTLSESEVRHDDQDNSRWYHVRWTYKIVDDELEIVNQSGLLDDRPVKLTRDMLVFQPD